ncbi:MAG: indolepyruvate ferredoxin oxidoreductase subunit alpha [Thermoprotei archaeon]|nr:MAG: indolepyruvate ferredoxin oxidoreductase subunit alpha [Thermoprotei archaeon]
MTKYLLAPPGEEVLLMGNEAIARGMLEAGIAVASAYPGTPSTEIIEALSRVAEEVGIYVEWSTNEKVAIEVAIGASMCGVRAAVAMKHVGVNVASDPLMSLGYSGVEGGLVIVTADDPNAHSSQNEQDNRYYGMHAYIPVFEPSSPSEAKDLTRDLYDLSERYKTAVFLRPTTRVCHVRGNVVLGELKKPERVGVFRRDFSRWVLLPVNSRRLHEEAINRIEKLADSLHEFKYNFLKKKDGSFGVIASGIAYNYAVEALMELGIYDKATVLKLASTYPLPRKLVKEFFDNVEGEVLVVEELDPIVEWNVKVFAKEEGIENIVHGKDLLPRVRELDTSIVASAIAGMLGKNYGVNVYYKPTLALPPRPPTMCPGCGHRAAFYELKIASAKAKVKAVYPGDIGCYTLGFFPPYRLVDISFSMGSGLGIGLGIAKASDELVVATIGDSTFFHAGIPALINAVYNTTPILLVVMDNGVTAMTGHQPHPGSGYRATGSVAKSLKIEDIARAVGVEFVEVLDPYAVDASIRKLIEAIEYVKKEGKPAVIIARRPCALIVYRQRIRRGEKIDVYYVDQNKCAKCGICVNLLACPAIYIEEAKYFINPTLCTGCGVCAQICPFKAISLRGGRSEE